MPETKVKMDASLSLNWKATYYPGSKDDVYQIFLLSTPKPEEASELKRRIDSQQRKHRIGTETLTLVGVVRPPNPETNNSSFGVALASESLRAK